MIIAPNIAALTCPLRLQLETMSLLSRPAEVAIFNGFFTTSVIPPTLFLYHELILLFTVMGFNRFYIALYIFFWDCLNRYVFVCPLFDLNKCNFGSIDCGILNCIR